jgi:hypothetical protein
MNSKLILSFRPSKNFSGMPFQIQCQIIRQMQNICIIFGLKYATLETIKSTHFQIRIQNFHEIIGNFQKISIDLQKIEIQQKVSSNRNPKIFAKKKSIKR